LYDAQLGRASGLAVTRDGEGAGVVGAGGVGLTVGRALGEGLSDGVGAPVGVPLLHATVTSRTRTRQRRT
jgi:hypothetical protein